MFINSIVKGGDLMYCPIFRQYGKHGSCKECGKCELKKKR